MFQLIIRSLRDKKYQTIIYSIASIAFLELYISIFPSIQKESANMSKLIDSYPEAMLKAFNIDKAALTFEDLGAYLAMEHFSFIWPIIVIILAISFANYAISNELEKGTIEHLLSQPISRTKVFISRYLAGAINLLGYSALSILMIFPLAAIHNVEIWDKGVWVVFAISLLFTWAVYGLAFLGSAFFSEKGKASIVASGTLIIMYVLNIVAGLKESLDYLRYFSFFYYYNSMTAIMKGEYIDGAILVYVGVAVLSSLLALYWFSRRDVSA